jgi:hypothetical protein
MLFEVLCLLTAINQLQFKVAEGVGFEPTVGLLLLLISSQVPLTTQPPFLRPDSLKIAG